MKGTKIVEDKYNKRGSGELSRVLEIVSDAIHTRDGDSYFVTTDGNGFGLIDIDFAVRVDQYLTAGILTPIPINLVSTTVSEVQSIGKKEIAVDLDGTLAEYHGWKGCNHIGDIVPAMKNKVDMAIDAGCGITIFTARASEQKAIKPIQDWCLKHFGVIFPITNIKHKMFSEFWDDRAKGVVMNTGKFECNS
jgi:hypothetical protein